MLPAIQLNDKPFLDTDEINNEWPYRMLTSEFATIHFSVSQVTPEQSFCIRHSFSQGSCPIN